MIVGCAAYADGRRVADIDLEAVSEWVAKDGHFVWIGLHEPSAEILEELQRELHLHELAVEDAHCAHQRPKLEEYGPCLFVVMRTASWNRDAEFDTGETHIMVGARYVVSVRHGETLGYADVRARCESTPRLLRHGPGFVLYALMDSIVDRYFPVVDALEEGLDKLEEGIFGTSVQADVAERIYDAKRRGHDDQALGVAADRRLPARPLRPRGSSPTRCGRTSVTSTTTWCGSTRAWTTFASSSRPRSRRTCR